MAVKRTVHGSSEDYTMESPPEQCTSMDVSVSKLQKTCAKHHYYQCYQFLLCPQYGSRVLWWMHLSVCLSVIISLELHARIFTNLLCTLPTVTARSFSGGILIGYVFPVLWMTSYLHKLWLLDVAARLRQQGSHTTLGLVCRNTSCRQQMLGTTSCCQGLLGCSGVLNIYDIMLAHPCIYSNKKMTCA